MLSDILLTIIKKDIALEVSWKSPDGIASSDGHAKKSMKSLIAKGKRFERESEDFTDIPDREEIIYILS